MRVGENAPTQEQLDLTTNESLRRLIREKTYLEEQDPMDPQVKEYNILISLGNWASWWNFQIKVNTTLVHQ